MFTLAQPACHFYNPYEELAMRQELQRRRQMEYIRRQREDEEMERRRREYEAALRAEYERRRQAELQQRRQAQQARGRHSMYGGGLESLFDALYGGDSRHQGERQPNVTPRNVYTSPARSPVPASASSPAPAEPTPAAPEPTPELEHNQEEPQVDTAPSHATIQSILSSFTKLQSEFTLPTHLDFIPNSSKLAYTPNNAPLHGYEHALTGLLTRLDAVESYGDDGIRKARKEAVKTIERELERLDGVKAEVWKRTNEPAVDPVAVPLPEDEEMEELSVADQCTVSEEPMALTDSPTELVTPSDVNHSISLEQPDTDLALTSTSPLDLNFTAPDDTTIPHTAAEPLARSLTSPSPSEASDSDSDSDLEGYVDVETMSTSEDGDTDLEEVEKEVDLELMGDWDLDF